MRNFNKDYGEKRTQKAIIFLDEYIEMKGYKANSHYLAIRKWVFNAIDRDEKQNNHSIGDEEDLPELTKRYLSHEENRKKLQRVDTEPF